MFHFQGVNTGQTVSVNGGVNASQVGPRGSESMCVKHPAQVQINKEKSDSSDMRIPSLLGQETLGKSHHLSEPQPSIKWICEDPTP